MGFMSGFGVEHCRETVDRLWHPHVAGGGSSAKKQREGKDVVG